MGSSLVKYIIGIYTNISFILVLVQSSPEAE